MFEEWPGNEGLSVKELRLKTLTLLALVIMLRPSDVAPHGVVYSSDTDAYHHILLTTEQVVFEQDSSVTMLLHGTKKDFT